MQGGDREVRPFPSGQVDLAIVCQQTSEGAITFRSSWRERSFSSISLTSRFIWFTVLSSTVGIASDEYDYGGCWQRDWVRRLRSDQEWLACQWDLRYDHWELTHLQELLLRWKSMHHKESVHHQESMHSPHPLPRHDPVQLTRTFSPPLHLPSPPTQKLSLRELGSCRPVEKKPRSHSDTSGLHSQPTQRASYPENHHTK